MPSVAMWNLCVHRTNPYKATHQYLKIYIHEHVYAYSYSHIACEYVNHGYPSKRGHILNVGRSDDKSYI